MRDLREEKKITQEKLAKSVGTSRQTICAMEKGEYIPSLRLALLLAKFFNKPKPRRDKAVVDEMGLSQPGSWALPRTGIVNSKVSY